MASKLLVFAFLICTGTQTNFAQDRDHGFALYLLPPSITSSDLAKLDVKQLKPNGKPFITADDISWYLKDNHELTLDYEVGLRLKKLAVPVSGRPFVVFSGDEPVYAGAFWNSFSSISFKGVVINVSNLKGDFPLLKLELGYPPLASENVSFDPRPDPRIFKALEKRSVLREEVWMYGKCRNIYSTGKRRNSYVFTFTVSSVVKSTYPLPEVVFEIFDDYGKSLRSAVEAGWKRVDQLNIEWHMNREKDILLKFTRRVSDKPEKVYLADFEIKD
jgi:hypothetical protein